MDRGGDMNEIVFQCETPDMMVRLYDFHPTPSCDYACMSFGLEIRTQAFRVQKRMQGFLLELRRLSTDLVTLMKGRTDSLRLSFLGEFFYLELNRHNEREIILKCEIACYEETREMNFESEGILKNDDLASLHQQMEIVLNTIDS